MATVDGMSGLRENFNTVNVMIDELLSGIDYLLQVNTEKLNNALSFKEGILKN